MPDQILDYRSPPRGEPLPRHLDQPRRSVLSVCGNVGALVLILNGLLLWIANDNRNEIALGIAVFFSPLCNVILLAVCIVAIRRVRRTTIRSEIALYVVTGITLPISVYRDRLPDHLLNGLSSRPAASGRFPL